MDACYDVTAVMAKHFLMYDMEGYIPCTMDYTLKVAPPGTLSADPFPHKHLGAC